MKTLQYQLLDFLRESPDDRSTAEELAVLTSSTLTVVLDALNDLLRQGRVRCRFGEWEMCENRD